MAWNSKLNEANAFFGWFLRAPKHLLFKPIRIGFAITCDIVRPSLSSEENTPEYNDFNGEILTTPGISLITRDVYDWNTCTVNIYLIYMYMYSCSSFWYYISCGLLFMFTCTNNMYKNKNNFVSVLYEAFLVQNILTGALVPELVIISLQSDTNHVNLQVSPFVLPYNWKYVWRYGDVLHPKVLSWLDGNGLTMFRLHPRAQRWKRSPIL